MEIQPTHSINQTVNGADTDQVAHKKNCRRFDETKSSLVSLSQHSQEGFTSTVWDIVTWPYQMLLRLWAWLFGAKKEDELLGGKKKCTATSCHGDHGSCCGGGSVSTGGGGLSRKKSVAFDLSSTRSIRPDSNVGVQRSLVRRGTDVDLTLQQPVDPEGALRALLKERGVTEEEFRSVLATVNKTFAEVAKAYFTDRDEPSLAYITWVIQNIEVERLRASRPPEDDLESQGTDELEEVQDEELLSRKRSDAAQQALRVYLQQQNIDEASFTRLIHGFTFAEVAMAWHTRKAEGVRAVQGIVLQMREQALRLEQQANLTLRAYLRDQNINEAGFNQLLKGNSFSAVAMAWHAKQEEGVRLVEGIVLQLREQAAKYAQQAEAALRKLLTDQEIGEEEFTARLGSDSFSEVAVRWYSRERAVIGRVFAIITNLKEERPPPSLDDFLAERGILMDEFLEFLAKEGGARAERKVRQEWDDEKKREALVAKINKLKSHYQRFAEQRLSSHVLSAGLSQEMFKKAMQEDATWDFGELATAFSQHKGDAEEYVREMIEGMKQQKKKPAVTEAAV